MEPILHTLALEPVRVAAAPKPVAGIPVDVFDLAALELPRWQSMLSAINGPIAGVQFFTGRGAAQLLFVYGDAPNNEYGLKLHIGNPGPAGTEHLAAETATRLFTFSEPNEGRVIRNKTAVEWAEVKAKETYSFISVWPTTFSVMLFYAELTAPVSVEVGDTVRFNKETLVMEVP